MQQDASKAYLKNIVNLLSKPKEEILSNCDSIVK